MFLWNKFWWSEKWKVINTPSVTFLCSCALSKNDSIHSRVVLVIVGIVILTIPASLLTENIFNDVTVCSCLFVPGKLFRIICESCLQPTNIDARSNCSLSDSIILFLTDIVFCVDVTDVYHCWNQLKHLSIWYSILSDIVCTGLGSSKISIILLETK